MVDLKIKQPIKKKRKRKSIMTDAVFTKTEINEWNVTFLQNSPFPLAFSSLILSSFELVESPAIPLFIIVWSCIVIFHLTTSISWILTLEINCEFRKEKNRTHLGVIKKALHLHNPVFYSNYRGWFYIQAPIHLGNNIFLSCLIVYTSFS